MQDKLNPLWVFFSAFGLSSFSGLAALLRAGKSVTGTAIFSAMLNSGLLGAALALLWYNKFQCNIYFLVGICILAGLGGSTLVEFVVVAMKSMVANKTGLSREELEKMASLPDDRDRNKKEEEKPK